MWWDTKMKSAPVQLSIKHIHQPACSKTAGWASYIVRTRPNKKQKTEKMLLELNAALVSFRLLCFFPSSLALFVVRAPEAVESRAQAGQQSYWSISPPPPPPPLPHPHSPFLPRALCLSVSLPLFRPCCVFGSYYWPSWTSLPIFVKTGTYGSWSAICHTEYFLAISPICIIAGSGIKVAHY